MQEYAKSGSQKENMKNDQYGQNGDFQPAPTKFLYEKARSVTVSKSTPQNRRSGHPSQRRPWTQEEETALMEGLDRVRGPHWSQILALYGPKGSISEILKDRNQVQLKDKARNLKLFFLKSNIEVPYYLQCVTGELRTRAPHAASRKEAGERAKGDGMEMHGHSMVAQFGGVIGHPANWPLQNSYQPPQHHSPYAPQHLPYGQQPPQQPPNQPMEQSSSSQGAELLDPVGLGAETKTEILQPANPSPPEQLHTQERAVQQAMQLQQKAQETSADEQLATRLKAEVDRPVSSDKPDFKNETDANSEVRNSEWT